MSSRSFIVLLGSQSWCKTSVQKVIGSLSKNQYTWLHTDKQKPSIIKQKNQAWLGQTLKAAIYNAHDDFNPEILLMISGCIEDGGALILLIPPMNNWINQISPSYLNLLSYGTIPKLKQDFLNWFCKQLHSDKNIKLFYENKSPLTDLPVFFNPTIKPFKITPCQARAGHAITTLYLSRNNYPLIITGPRGRGKSALLGHTAKNLIKQYNANIIITAMHLNSTQSIQKHSSPHKLFFFSPDYLVGKHVTHDALIIEEAAAMPTGLLYQLINHYSKVILTSTLEGYEGTALNFQYKTIPQLIKKNPNTHIVEMTTGIRFKTPCQVETFLNRTFYLKQAKKLVGELAYNPGLKLDFSVLSSKTLQSDPKKLNQIFTLLKHAHYRTTINDLRQLMDNPDLFLATISHGKTIIGILQAIPEGNLPNNLATAIMLGTRRVQGHLVAQSLGLYLYNRLVMLQKSYRIHRICITPQWQTKTLGSQLIDYTCAQLTQKKINFISVSFGAAEKLLHFWRKNNFQTVRIGYRLGTSTGLHSLFMLKPLTLSGKILTSQLKEIGSQQLSVYLKLMANPWPSFLIETLPVNKSKPMQDNRPLVNHFNHYAIPLMTALPYIIPILKKNKSMLENNKKLYPLYLLLVEYNLGNPAIKNYLHNNKKEITVLLKSWLGIMTGKLTV